MTFEVYIPSNTDAVVATVKEANSVFSSTYMVTSPTAPSILSRSLTKLVANTPKVVDASLVPLEEATTHSSGNLSKARSIDTEMVVANVGGTSEVYFFVADLKDLAYSVRYSFEENGIYFFYITSQSASVESSPLSTAKVSVANLSDLGTRISSVIDTKTIDGYAIPSLSISSKLSADIVQRETTGSGGTATETYLTLTPQNTLTNTEERSLKTVSFVTATLTDGFETTTRCLNIFKYNSSTKAFTLYSTNSEVTSNIRDYLEKKGVEGYSAFLGRLPADSGLLFNTEVIYNKEGTITDTNVILNSIGDSRTVAMTDTEGFEEYTQLTYVLPTSSFKSVKIYRKEQGVSTRTILARRDTIGTPQEWATFFLTYGISCLLKTDTSTTSFILKRLYETESKDISLQLDFESSEKGVATTLAEGFSAALVNALDSEVSLPAFPSKVTTTTTTTTVVFKMGSVYPTNKPSNISYVGYTNKESFTLSVAKADILSNSGYSRGTSELSFIKTPFFNIGYGVKEANAAIANALTTSLGVVTSTNDYYARVYLNTAGKGIKHSYLQTSEDYMLNVNKDMAYLTKNEALLLTDPLETKTISFKAVPSLAYAVVDLAFVEKLTLTPFAYINGEELVQEQNTAELSFDIVHDYTTSTERFNLFNTIATEASTSIVSQFLTPIIPLYTQEGTFAEALLIVYDPCTIEGRELVNALLKTEADGYIVSSTTTPLQYVSGVKNGAKVFKSVSTTPLDALEKDLSYYIDIKGATSAGLYTSSASFKRSVMTNEALAVLVKNELGEVLETATVLQTTAKDEVSGISSTTTAIVSKYLSVTQITEDTFSISLQNSIDQQRLTLLVKQESAPYTVLDTGLFFEKEGYYYIPINKGA